MSSSTVEAVVLRRWDSGESDRRISLLTRERGKIPAIARGARKANSKLAGISEPLSHSKIELAGGRSNEYVTQVQPLAGFPKLRTDYIRLGVALAFAEVLDSILPVGEKQPEVFDLCLIVFASIEISTEPLAPLCWADLQLMDLAGFAPEFGVSTVSGKPITGEPRFLCPAHGGAILRGEFDERDRVHRITRNTSISLKALQQISKPPSFLKSAHEVMKAIYPFWLEISSRGLPARKSLLDSFS